MTYDTDPDLSKFDFDHAMANYVLAHIVHVKTGTSATAETVDDTNLLPAVAVFRQEELVTWIIADQVDRDKGLQAAYGAIVGFGADEILIGLDARMLITGSQEEMEALKRGDIQRMAEEEGTDILGITVECLMVHRFKDGFVQAAMLPYLTPIDDTGKPHIEWLEDRFTTVKTSGSDEEEFALQGVVPETVQAYFEKAREVPDLASLGTDVLGMTHSESQMHVDCAIMKLLTGQGLTVMYNADTEEKRHILMESTKHGVLEGLDAQFAYGGAVEDDGGFTPGGFPGGEE